MQISFLKDLATPRDPTSPFSFVKYLQEKKRFNEFLNLGTFLPTRLEYDDYMRWCAEKFLSTTTFNAEVERVEPYWNSDGSKVNFFTVTYKNRRTCDVYKTKARHVVISAGGKPNMPRHFEYFSIQKEHAPLAKIVHSSQYMTSMPKLKKTNSFAVVGGGQSAAEIFIDLCTRFPKSEVTLVCRSDALKPSDDSPL